MFRFTSLEEDFGRKTDAKNALKSSAILCGVVPRRHWLYALAGTWRMSISGEIMFVVGLE
jgi:hypothetical protein